MRKKSNVAKGPVKSAKPVQKRNYSTPQKDKPAMKEIDIQEAPIYKLLKVFKLQQYAKKLHGYGYGDDLERISQLTNDEKDELITKMNAFPGHRIKLRGVFDTIDNLMEVKGSLKPAHEEAKKPSSSQGRAKKEIKTVEKASADIAKKPIQKTPVKKVEQSKAKKESTLPKIENFSEKPVTEKPAIEKLPIEKPKLVPVESVIHPKDVPIKEEPKKEKPKKESPHKDTPKKADEHIIEPKILADEEEELPSITTAIEEDKIAPKAVIEEEKGPSAYASLGLGYFFGESVPMEVEDLMASLKNYADELETAERKKEVSEEPKEDVKEEIPKPVPTTLEKIEEEPSDVSVPSIKKETAPATAADEGKQCNLRLSIRGLKEEKKVPAGKKKKAGEFGASMDSATLTGAIGVIDLKSLCKSFSIAILQHIIFSNGKAVFKDLEGTKETGETRFSYHFNKMLKIELEEKKEGTVEESESQKQGLDINKCKDILSESLAAISGTHVQPELLNSYLTIEGDDHDDLDMSYTQAHIGEFQKSLKEKHNKNITTENLIKTYRNSVASLKSSEALRNTLLRTQNAKRMTIQSQLDAGKVTNPKGVQNRKSEIVHRRQSSDELAREENEAVDLASVDVTKSYTSPTKLQKALGPLQEKIKEPENPFGIAQIPHVIEPRMEIKEEETEDYKIAFAVYSLNYDFETSSYLDLATIPKEYLVVPSQRDIYKFCKKIVLYSKMEKQIPIIALIYIEKLMMKTGLLMNELNWRRFTFIALVIASKVWDDESFENIHFTKVFPDISLKEINELERIYLGMLEYMLHINGSEYAKYYFILRTISEQDKKKFPIAPMPLDQVLELQKKAKVVQEHMKLEHKNVTFLKTQ